MLLSITWNVSPEIFIISPIKTNWHFLFFVLMGILIGKGVFQYIQKKKFETSSILTLIGIAIVGMVLWDKYPIHFMTPKLEIRWYGMAFAMGFMLGYKLLEKMFSSEKVPHEWVDKIFIYVFVATIVGARLGHVIFYDLNYYLANPSEILKTWHGGLASHGGTIGIIIAIYFYSKYITKRSMIWALDRLAVPVALVAMMIRLGNLMNSEIYGVVTDLPWGVIFARNGETVAKHPTQVYEALSYLFTFATLMCFYWKTNKKEKEGFLLGVFFIGVFLSRFLIEFIKEDQEAFEAGMLLNMGQLLSIPFVLAGIYLIYRSSKKR
ncbi:prolipoprotein diacylglyceryl transferase [Prolixibacteraceae bacterium]|nr:prolipoprotein diacylglyceryl transferase [Prolixibacteraceae bacterium]